MATHGSHKMRRNPYRIDANRMKILRQLTEGFWGDDYHHDPSVSLRENVTNITGDCGYNEAAKAITDCDSSGRDELMVAFSSGALAPLTVPSGHGWKPIRAMAVCGAGACEAGGDGKIYAPSKAAVEAYFRHGNYRRR